MSLLSSSIDGVRFHADEDADHNMLQGKSASSPSFLAIRRTRGGDRYRADVDVNLDSCAERDKQRYIVVVETSIVRESERSVDVKAAAAARKMRRCIQRQNYESRFRGRSRETPAERIDEAVRWKI